jgi:SAM-dependent methyltransferase
MTALTWCARDTPAPFRFAHADLRNTTYNPGGSESPSSYRFPYDDGSFDLVIATSVFTHLLADAAEHYLAETARVLASGGRLFSTWYLLSGEQRSGPPAPFEFHDATRPAAVADRAEPESAVAFTEDWLRESLRANGFEPPSVQPGSWAGRPGASRQDLVVAYVA